MNDFSISMALIDFVPVVFFAMATSVLIRNLGSKMSKGVFGFFAAGLFNVCIAGSLKALYKLLYAAGICDFEVLSLMMMPLQSIGFMMAGGAMLYSSVFKNRKVALSVAAPAFYKGTFLFVGLMCFGLGALDFSLCNVARRMKKPVLMFAFILSFICSLGMGYLSSKDFTQAFMNWVAQGVNTVGQASLYIGVKALEKAGLSNYEF